MEMLATFDSVLKERKNDDKRVSKKKYIHSVKVANMALCLADRFKFNDIRDDIYIAALFHDYSKIIFSRKKIISKMVKKYRKKYFKLKFESFHGFLSSKIVEDNFEVTNPDILYAIRKHSSLKIAIKSDNYILKTLVLAEYYVKHKKEWDKQKDFCDINLILKNINNKGERK